MASDFYREDLQAKIKVVGVGGGGSGLAISAVGAAFGVGVASVCIAAGVYAFFKTLFFGGLCVLWPFRRKGIGSGGASSR